MVCNGTMFEHIQTQTLAQLDGGVCKVTFVLCETCGHLQQMPPVPMETMAHHYKMFSSYELFGDAASLRTAAPSRHAERFLRIVEDLGLGPGRAYEIGCGAGEMLNQFQTLGWRVGGCDPAPAAASQAGSIFGIAVDIGGEEQFVPAQKKLDLVLLCHVLEHLYRPAETLHRIYGALAANGYLVFEVPCATAPHLLPPGWLTFEHLHYYTPEILELLLYQTGFDVLEIRIALKAEHYPVVTVAARKAAATRTVHTFIKGGSIARTYVDRDEAMWGEARRRLGEISGPCFIWGAGVHTAQLLDHTKLAERIEIIGIVDRDSKKWGHTLAGAPVISPGALWEYASDAPIIVSSFVSEAAIAKSLRDAGIPLHRIVTIYADAPRPNEPGFA
jgi:SAM-dependent methyltransferase